MDFVKIREAIENDLTILADFEQEIVKAEREYDHALKESNVHYYNFNDLLASPNAKVLLAEVDNEIVGSGFAEIRKAEDFLKHNEYVYIGLMYVKPAHRGKGINRQILQKLKDWAIEKNITELRLMVYDENTLAKNAYQKAGFKGYVLEMRMALQA